MRGELYRVAPPPGEGDPRRSRVMLVVGRQEVIDSSYSSVACVPVYSNAIGVETEVSVGAVEGLKAQSWLRCDEVTSVRKSRLTTYVGSARPRTMAAVGEALKRALDIA